jgi:hypothetical protein
MRKAYKIWSEKGMRLVGDFGIRMEDYTIINRVGGSAMHLSDFG